MSTLKNSITAKHVVEGFSGWLVTGDVDLPAGLQIHILGTMYHAIRFEVKDCPEETSHLNGPTTSG